MCDLYDFDKAFNFWCILEDDNEEPYICNDEPAWGDCAALDECFDVTDWILYQTEKEINDYLSYLAIYS